MFRTTYGAKMTSTIQATDELGKFMATQNDKCLINPVSMTPKEFTRQHGPYPDHAVIWHPKKAWPPARPPLTLLQRLLPWTRPKLTDAETWALRQLD